MEELQGQLEHITYFNEQNHFTIAKMKVKGFIKPVTVVGTLVQISPGEVLRLKGSWETHPSYGEQFKIISYETVMPATAKGIEKYLGSGLIKGIGPVMAKRLVDLFGAETLAIIESDIERLKAVEGIGSKRIGMIKTAWTEQKEIRDLMLFLQSHDISAGYAAKIYKHYGRESIKVIRENPYRLATDIFGVGFLTADRISEKLDIPRDSHMRAEAGIMYVLRQFSDDGHVYYPCDLLIEECLKILNIKKDIIETALKKLASDKKIIIENNSVYISELHMAEVSIAKRLQMIFSAPGNLILFDKNTILGWAQKELNIMLAGNQAKAVLDSLEKKVMVITGGPGTGKTTIINAIIRIFKKAGRQVLLSAPTGRAAKRMTEATGCDAKTIHRLLEYSPGKDGFKRNEETPLEADLIVIDESSMVDTYLMHHLLNAVPYSATLILVGDVDQLPSVGPGNVLKDIIDSGYIPTVRLTEIFRQAQESLITLNAHRINTGEFPVITSSRDRLQDFYFVEIEDPQKVSETVINMCRTKIPGKFGYDPFNDIQVITPMHRGIVGTSNLNSELQKQLNACPDELVRGSRILKTGDKVMQVKNNYDKDVFNGDIGRIISINREDQEINIDYDGRTVVYDFNELDELILSYAISVHKSQGSEYAAVVMPLLTQHYLLLQRNLLYTAITRGKKLVVLIGTKKALGIAIRNNKPQMRYTKLRERLIRKNN